MTELCRAALWYSTNIEIADTKLHGIKALRECSRVKMRGCDIISPEFGWSVQKGKYSFQYIQDSVFEGCIFDTKDAFRHAKNVMIRNSVIKGEYLA